MMDSCRLSTTTIKKIPLGSGTNEQEWFSKADSNAARIVKTCSILSPTASSPVPATYQICVYVTVLTFASSSVEWGDNNGIFFLGL